MSDNGMKTETLKLKLEAGKKYVDRRGRVFGPMMSYDHGFWGESASMMALWFHNGKIGFRSGPDHDMDLVAEYHEPGCCPAEPIIASLHNDCECCGPFESFEPVEVQVEIVNSGKPQRGQFWAYNSNRKCCVFMIGKNIDGHWVSVDRNGEYEVFNGHRNMSFEYWHHEPGFMNFDGPIPAEQEQNAEDNPNKWVTQDRVAPRDNIDEYTWMKIGLKPTEENWRRGEGNFSNCYRHGTRHFDEVLHVRCRLRDLPPLPAEKTSEKPAEPTELPSSPAVDVLPPAEPKRRQENQDTITGWANATFGPAGSNARVASRANEEMAELLRALTADDNHPKAAEEVADIIIILYRVASRLGVDLHDEIDRKMKINRNREWNLDKTGHGYHVRDKSS